MNIGKEIIKQIQKETECDQIRIKLDEKTKPGITDSKVGGIPYWPAGKKIPLGKDGCPMIFLAQFNCEKLPKNSDLPDHGMLQFFITADWEIGECAVIFHETIDGSVTEESSAEIYMAAHNGTLPDYLPYRKECSMIASVEKSFMPICDIHCEAMYKEILDAQYRNSREAPAKLNDAIEELSDADFSENTNPSEGHHLLGYPYFTQYDPREPNDKYDRLLFQLDSENRGKNWLVIWGDVGVGNFFINSEALKNCDFSDVFFAWDCC